MGKILSEDIHIISRHSNWPSDSIEKTLEERVYNNATAWKKFLKYFLLSLGLGFTVAGIIFFFAYNWADLHKFAKLDIIQGLIAIVTVLAILPRFSKTVRDILLTAASILVGVLFAVFGQIYQTGANAYDFFLAWTICITLWVLVSNFPPLWLVWLILVNTTHIFYMAQVAFDLDELVMYTLLTLLNAVFLLSSMFVNWSRTKVPIWFTNTIVLAVVSFATIGMIVGIFERYQLYFIILIVITAILYTGGIIYGLLNKRVYYLALIPFSLIIIISALFLRASDDAAMFLFTSLFIIASISFLIMQLIKIQKQWANETGT